VQSIFQFWNRAFPDLTWSRDFELARCGAAPVRELVNVRLLHTLRRPADPLPRETTVFLEHASRQTARGAQLAVTLGADPFTAISQEGRKVLFHFDPEKSINAMLRERYCIPPAPLASCTPFHYHAVPGAIRRIIGRVATMLGPKLGEGFPPWPIADSVEVLRMWVLFLLAEEAPDLNDAAFWPDGKKWAVALTHDADTRHGAARVPDFRDLETRRGFRSTWFFPACHYKLNSSLLQGLVDAGHEVACHGYNHDCKLPYLKPKWISDRLGKCVEILSPFDAEGFRSPALGRAPALFKELPRYFAYDSSVPDTEAGAGCCTLFPYFMGDLLELPITVPMDATLLLHGYKPAQVLDAWIKKIGWIKKMHGLATIVTHPEPHFSGNAAMLDVYAELLAHLAKDADLWIAPLSEIADWWRRTATDP